MKAPLTLLAAALVCTTASHGQSILLGGFDGNQTQNAIAPATATSNSGVRELTGALQSAGAVGAATTRIWTNQATNKELQWNTTGGSNDGLWGASTFTPAASTSTSKWVVTQQNASWINFEISNSGTENVTLDKFHINARRLNSAAAPTGSPDTLTISLQQNGTFANPPVLSPSDLTASGTQTITLNATTSWDAYEFALSSMLSDLILAPGETATLRIANNAGGGRLYLDNIAISGIIGSAPGGTVDAGQSSVAASPLVVLAGGTSTITVTLKDSGGIPVASEDVTLSSSGPGTPTISPSSTQTTNASGIATFTVSSITPGTEVFTATSSTESIVVTETASVEFQSAVVDAGSSTVLASPAAVLADDTETSIITVTVRNAGGQLLPGKVVSLAGDGSATIAPATDTTNASGVATFTVKSGTVGLETFTATSESVTITGTASVQFQDVGATSILLAGFDGHNTYEIPDGSGGFNPGGGFQSEGDKYIRDPHQRAAAATAGFTAELYMFSDVAKEPQWGGAGQTSLGYWGTGATALATPPNTADGINVFTVVAASTTEFRVQNTGSGDITLEKIHFSVKLDAGAGVDMTVSYASGDLTASGGGGSTVVTYTSSANTGYDVDLTSILSDNVLGAGDSAVFTLVSAAGTNRMRIDDIAISGTIGAGSVGPTYGSWSGGSPAGDDDNGDGVKNAVAYALGALDVNENAISRLPILNNSDPSNFVFTFDRSDAAEADSTTAITVQYGSDLSNWTTAVNGEGGVTIDDSAVPSAGLHTVVVTIPKSGNKLFAHLKVVVTP